MPKIDISGWGEFRIGDLFTQERGKESSPNRVEDGDLPMVNEINTNNGIAKRAKSLNVILGNCITVSVNYATNVFYQKEDFCASVNILVLRSININEYSGKFIAAILSRKNLKYDYTNKISKDRLNNETIKLPIDSKGEPDWLYMENYMRNIEVKVKDSISKLELIQKKENKKIDISSWGEFCIGNLFEIKRPDARSKSNYIVGKTPFVASGNFNNGVVEYLQPKEDEKLDKGNCITVSPLDGSSFYQKEDFLGRGGAGSAIIILYNNNLNEYSGLFIASSIRRSLNKYSYNDQLSSGVIVSEKIYLPINSKGEPDWLYMENYMKKIEKNVQKRLELLKKEED